MPDPILDPPPSDPPKKDKRVCGFCESMLAENGDVLRMSDRAKEFGKLERKHEDLNQEHVKLQGELEAAQKTIAQLRAEKAVPAKKSFRLFGG